MRHKQVWGCVDLGQVHYRTRLSTRLGQALANIFISHHFSQDNNTPGSPVWWRRGKQYFKRQQASWNVLVLSLCAKTLLAVTLQTAQWIIEYSQVLCARANAWMVGKNTYGPRQWFCVRKVSVNTAQLVKGEFRERWSGCDHCTTC